MLAEYTVPMTGYNLKATMECGQYFRGSKVGDKYLLLQKEQYCFAQQDGNQLHLEIQQEESDEATEKSLQQWKEVLDISDVMQRDTSNFLHIMSSTPFLREALEFSNGLHILRQDPWECLISLILSQRNSVERIRQCVDNICWAAGVPFDVPNAGIFYTFPTPNDLIPSIIDECGLGYRTKYVYGAAAAMRSKSIDLYHLTSANVSLNVALQHLMFLNGVGHKVASCVALFSLGHGRAWPVDIWIERAMQEANITYEDVLSFGEDAGLIQEYIYYYVTHRDKIRVY